LEERKKNFRKGCNETDALVRWANLCGFSAMDEDLFSFVCDEIKVVFAEDSELVKNWQKMLCRLIEVMLANGMPMEKLDPRPNFQEEMRQSRNAEESLLAVLNACARNTQEISNINWHSPEVFGAWIARLQPQRNEDENTLAFHCLSFLNLEESILVGKYFYDANLDNSNLKNSDFYHTILIGASLSEANLEGANLSEANLDSANLWKANLQEAYLERVDLSMTDLEVANLSIAHLSRANLSKANLEGANLWETSLEGANLSGANLSGANLRGANLSGANLERADLERVDLEGANLEGTILEGKDIAEISKITD
jgi:uncharacterized protein YjbI with pentapeptide repeats